MIEVSADNKTESARIMVIGVGGGGNNAVNSMVEDGVLGVTYACLNTDKQALERCQADYHLQIGQQLTKGLGYFALTFRIVQKVKGEKSCR